MRSSILCFVLGLAACAAPNASSDDAEQSTAEANGQLRVVFDETVIRAFPGGDFAWYDAGRSAVMSLGGERAWGQTQTSWIERRWDRVTSTWIEVSRKVANATDPAGLNVNEDHAYVEAAGAILRVDATGGVQSWAGGQWNAKTAPGAFPARKRFSVAYDGARKRIVLFGGAKTNDTWEWDGAAWSQVASAGPPATTLAGAMAFDPIRKSTVLAIGGQGTWLWDGSAWTQAAAVAPPSQTQLHPIWNPTRKVVTAFTGDALAEWNGSTWKALPLREGGYRRMTYSSRVCAYDPVAKRFVETGVGGGTWLALEYRITNLANVAPELGTLPPQVAYPGDTFVLIPAGRDADGDRLTYAITPLPAGARTSAGDGALVWTPTFDDLGVHVFDVTASDASKSATGKAEVTVREPLFAALLPRGPIAKLGATVSVGVTEDTQWDNGSAGGTLGGSAVSLACTYAGDNPTGLTVTCRASGNLRGGNAPGAFALSTAPVRVRGDGRASISYQQGGESLYGEVTLRASSTGSPELVVTNFHYSKRVRFGMLGWPGSDVLTQVGAAPTAPITTMP